MASKFLPGMKNVLEVLNQMWDAFAAGPFNALPSVGGSLTGPVVSTSTYQGRSVEARDAAGIGRIQAYLSVANEPSLDFQRWTGSGADYFGGRVVLSSEGWRVDVAPTGAVGAQNFMTGLVVTLNGDTIARRLLPMVDNAHDLGQASVAYRTVYARTGTINTSDARLKTDFRNITPAEIAAACEIARAIGIYRWRDAVDCKGADAREHVGPTVQRAIEIMQAHGLDPFNYGFICHDTWEQQTVEHPAIEARPAIPATEAAPEVLNSFGDVITPAVLANDGQQAVEARAAYTEVTLEAGDRYAFRYDELAMFIAAGQEARLAALEAA